MESLWIEEDRLGVTKAVATNLYVYLGYFYIDFIIDKMISSSTASGPPSPLGKANYNSEK